MRRNVTLAELKTSVTLGEYQSKLVDTAIAQQKQVQEFYPCTLSFVVDGSTLEYAEMELTNKSTSSMRLTISYQEYQKKWYIGMASNQFKNISTHQKTEIAKQLTEPKNIGVLTTKKIADWIYYYTTLYKMYTETNAVNKANVERELAVILADKDVKPMDSGKRGFIYRNGLRLEYNVYESYVGTQITLSPCSGYENFVALADNKYKGKD